MKKYLLSFMLILSMLLSDFASAGNASLPAPTVVAQMDSYIAMRLDEDCPLSFYLIFQEKQPFQGREIVRVFLDDDKNLDYRDYQMTKVSQLDNCNGVSLMGFIYPKKAGHYEISSIRVTFFDGSSETYPIGRLVVDVYDEVGSDALYTYATAAISSRADLFGFTYEKRAENVTFLHAEMDLQADVKLLQADFTASRSNGKTALCAEFSFESDLPVVYRYVVPRIHILVDDEEQIVYPKVGCACGAAQVTEEQVLEAYRAWNPTEE